MKKKYFSCVYPLDPETASFLEVKLAASPPNYRPYLLPSTALTRRYFRSLRAAEMAAWEMTGGDYLRSSFAA